VVIYKKWIGLFWFNFDSNRKGSIMKSTLVISAIISVFVGFCASAEEKPIKAVAVLTGAGIKGAVYFTQNGCGAPVLVDVNITGLAAGDHGFHIHERGDLTDGCASLGAHYNPDKLDHGAPKDEIRHVGDLGNVRADSTGLAKTIFSDSLISLTGSRSIIGRGLIVHQDIDDLGKGGHPDSLKTGNAGARAACGVIGYLELELPFECNSTDSEKNSANMLSSLVTLFLPVVALILWN